MSFVERLQRQWRAAEDRSSKYRTLLELTEQDNAKLRALAAELAEKVAQLEAKHGCCT